MDEKEPTAGQPYFAGDTTPWLEARERLADADTYWLATVRTDGLPHLVPLLGVWVGGALHFVASRTSRKAKNLARATRTASSRRVRTRSIWWSRARPRRCRAKSGSIALPRRTCPSTDGR